MAVSLWVFIGCATHHNYHYLRGKRVENPLKMIDAHCRIYDADGRPSGLDEVIERAGNADVLLVGESHHDPTAHILQAEILKRIHTRHFQDAEPGSFQPLLLSMEMFERDLQIVLDEYLAGLIAERHFLADSRAWENYADYEPLIEFAREHEIPVIAANAPRRYVNRVSRLGPDSLNDLSPKAKFWLPPLPYSAASSEYRVKFESLGEKARPHKQMTSSEMMKKHRPYLIDAQALWDASMAFSIAEALKREPGTLVLNINGRFHSEQGLGIPEHLPDYSPDARIITVTILPDKCFPDFNEKFRGFGDFVIITDPNLF